MRRNFRQKSSSQTILGRLCKGLTFLTFLRKKLCTLCTNVPHCSKPATTLAFLNADWRNFESTPAAEEEPDKAITTYDYHRLLTSTGWKTTHRIECPLSSERMTGNQVQKMQDRRILGTIGRTLLIAKKK